MKLSKFPKHIWLGVVLPLVLVGLGIWRFWPVFVEYRYADESKAQSLLYSLTRLSQCNECGGIHERSENFMAKTLDELAAKMHGHAEYAYIRIMREPNILISTDKDSLQFKADRCSRNRGVAFVGYCAYPIKYDWRHRQTFICTEKQIFSVDNGGKPIFKWPSDAELAESYTQYQLK